MRGPRMLAANGVRVRILCARSKACIDQSDIAANLACLPIFLSGCRELLCLAGDTYHTRLWCVMELVRSRAASLEPRPHLALRATLRATRACACVCAVCHAQFTFVQMGGAKTALSVVELNEGVRDALSCFDAGKARCFLSKDRHHLLAVMEAGFGDLQPFNRVIRRLLKERTVDHGSRPWGLKRLASFRVGSRRVLPSSSAPTERDETSVKHAWVGP